MKLTYTLRSTMSSVLFSRNVSCVKQRPSEETAPPAHIAHVILIVSRPLWKLFWHTCVCDLSQTSHITPGVLLILLCQYWKNLSKWTFPTDLTLVIRRVLLKYLRLELSVHRTITWVYEVTTGSYPRFYCSRFNNTSYPLNRPTGLLLSLPRTRPKEANGI